MSDDVVFSHAEALWHSLYDDALKSVEGGNHRAKERIQTLGRVREACDAILTGDAIEEAKTSGLEAKEYRGRKATPENIHSYCTKVRRYNGPHAVTLRKHVKLTEYIRLRNAEARVPQRSARQSDHQREVNDALNRIVLLDDRKLLWEEVERGRENKAKLDNLLHFVCQLPSVIVDALPGKKITIENLRIAPSALDEKSRNTLRVLVRNLTDNERHLRDFDLVFRSGRVKMDYGTGSDLILPEQMELLMRLAGIRSPVEAETR